MVVHGGLIRIFWPSDISRQTLPGVLVGFRNSETDVFVVSVLSEVEVGNILCLNHCPAKIRRYGMLRMHWQSERFCEIVLTMSTSYSIAADIPPFT